MAGLAKQIFQRGFADWEEMTGFEATAVDSQVRILKSSGPLLERIIGEDVLVSTHADGAVSGWALFVFPNSLVGSVIATALMLPPSEAPSADASNEQHVEAAMEMMNLFCGSATQALEDANHKLRVSQSVDHLHVQISPGTPPEIEDGSPMCCIHVDVVSGERTGRAWCLLPLAVATSL